MNDKKITVAGSYIVDPPKRVVASAYDVREIATELPRTVERLVRERIKFNVGRLVYVALSRDERTMGCGFPKEKRDAAIAAEPKKFFMPDVGDQRYRWIHVDLNEIDKKELRELITEAWRMCAPKTVVRKYNSRPA